MVSLDDTDMYTSDNEREDDIPAASDDTWFRDQLTQLSNPKPNYTEALRCGERDSNFHRLNIKKLSSHRPSCCGEGTVLRRSGVWIHELKVEQVKIVLRKRFTRIDNVCFGMIH